LEAIHLRHDHVEQHQVGVNPLQFLERAWTVMGGEDLIRLRAETSFQQGAAGGVVLDDKNSGGNAAHCSIISEEAGYRHRQIALVYCLRLLNGRTIDSTWYR